MHAIFETIEEYLAKLTELNEYLGYPNGNGTISYSTDNPRITIDNKYAMPISPNIIHLFAQEDLVDSVEYDNNEEIQ